MNDTEFRDLHARCVAAKQNYFREADKTCALLARCTSEPLSFLDRMALLAQEVIENRAHSAYLTIKNLLHRAARLGYGSSDLGADSDSDTDSGSNAIQ